MLNPDFSMWIPNYTLSTPDFSWLIMVRSWIVFLETPFFSIFLAVTAASSRFLLPDEWWQLPGFRGPLGETQWLYFRLVDRCSKSRVRERHKKEEQVGQKGRTVAKHCVFPSSGGSKSRLAKAAGAEPSGEMRDELHAVVARSARPSQNSKRQKHLSLELLFWKLGLWKRA